MSLMKIAIRSLQQRGVASALTMFSMALGVALMHTVLVVYGVWHQSLRNSANGYEMIVGKKGSSLQLVLNTVYHMGRSNEPLPWSFYKEFKEGGKYAAEVRFAIPYCMGDNFQGHRIVATTPELFDLLEYAPGRKYEFAAGRNFGREAALAAGETPPPRKLTMVLPDEDDETAAEHEHHHAHAAPPFFNEAVVGALVARQTGLVVGGEFEPTHGVSEGGDGHKHDPVKVVGILKPTGTPNDQAIFMNLEGFYLLDGHSKSGGHHHGGPLPEEDREVTAVLVKGRTFTSAPELARSINEGDLAMAAYPRQEIATLIDRLVGPMLILLLVLACLVVVVAGVGIIVGIYNSMNERRREIAVMRSLGARRNTVLAVVMLESLLLALGGGVLGFLLGHGLLAAAVPFILDRTGLEVGFWHFPTAEIRLTDGALVYPLELALLPGLVALAGLVGIFPAAAAYKTDVSRALGSAA